MGLVAVRPPGTLSAARHIIVQGIALLGRQLARDLAHDRNDLLHVITAGAAGSTSQQIPRRRADHRLAGPQTPNRPDTCCPPRSRSCSRRRRRAAGASGRHPDPWGPTVTACAPRRPASWSGRRWSLGDRPRCMSGGPRAARPVFTRSGAMSCGMLTALRKAFPDNGYVFTTERRTPFTTDAINRLIKNIGNRAEPATAGPLPHAAPLLRLQAGQRRDRYQGDPRLARPRVDHAHHALHTTEPGAVQGFWRD
jgi:hypothetical protein